MSSSPRPYQPRDVVNAPDIKAAIARRSAERGDSEAITAWLSNHFYRHIIGNFQAEPPAVQPIHHWGEFEAKYQFYAPDWAHKMLERLKDRQSAHLPFAPNPADTPPLAWWIEPDSQPLLTLEARLLEFLQSRQGTALEGKLQRINCPQALARWTLEHLEFARKQECGEAVHQPHVVRPLLQGSHGSFVEFDPNCPQLRQEMAFESQMMGHCLGQFADRQQWTGGYGEGYASACEQGRLRLISYRNQHGSPHPHITISVHVQPDGSLRMDQIKGKQNRPPIERYHADVLALLNHLGTDEHIPPDALDIGLVRRPDALRSHGQPAWCLARDLTSEAEQYWLLQKHPRLLHAEQLQSPLMQWLLAACYKKLSNQIPEQLLARMPRTLALSQTLQLAGIRI